MNKWKEYKLEDYCSKIGSGATPKGGKTVYLEDGINFIRSQNVHNLFFDSNGLAHITNEAAQKLKGVTLEKNDILLNITGDSVARCCLLPNEYLPGRVNQHVSIIRCKEQIDAKFLTYYLVSTPMQTYLLNIASGKGASRNAITKEMIEKLVVLAPDIATQKKIANILSCYDEAIENNNKRIKLLEQMAQNLYKEWFVRFRFPGNEKCEFENGIPKGWSYKNLFDVVNVTYGYAFASELFCDDEKLNPVVRIRDILDNHTTTFTSETCSDKYIIKENEILIGMDGIFHMCMWNGEKAYQNQRVVKLTSKSNEISNYFLFLAVQPQVKFWEQTITGTTVAHLGDKHLKRMNILLPSENILIEATKIFDSLMKQKNQLFKANMNLAKQRDLLLPRLMSGKLEVK